VLAPHTATCYNKLAKGSNAMQDETEELFVTLRVRVADLQIGGVLLDAVAETVREHLGDESEMSVYVVNAEGGAVL